jgi:hypothetical protein
MIFPSILLVVHHGKKIFQIKVADFGVACILYRQFFALKAFL